MARIYYNPKETPKKAKELAAKGLLDKDIAKALGISVPTLKLWRKKHPELNEAMKEGKIVPDDQVEASLFKKAMGYEVEEKEYDVEGDKKILKRTKTKHISPSDVAIIFWLKNRRPEEWRDKKEVNITDQKEIIKRKAEIKDFLKQQSKKK